MAEFRVQLQDIAGTDVYPDIPFDGWEFTEELNKGIDGNIDIAFQALKDYAEALQTTVNNITTGQIREVKIYSGSTLIFLGVINFRKTKGGKVGATKIDLTIGDYFTMLDKRRTAAYTFYAASDSSDIAWTEINASQIKTNGSLGITRGADPTTKDRQRTFRYDSIRDLIVGMSNEKVKDGFDYDIDTSKQFNIYYPTKGQTRNNIVLDDFNIIEWAEGIGLAGQIVNKAIVLGKGQGDDMAVSEREDTSAQATWLLHEDTVSEKGVESTDELDDRGDKFLEDNNEPSDTRKLTVTHLEGSPSITTYNVGDTLKIKISDLALDTSMRVMSRKIKFDRGHALVTLELEA